ncbi:class I SAM-dependent methyltransferase [Pedobacter chinensis]|uniref:Class I SAM-dependent methyltransferase n=1 Tax=Pedobacter chinensis TaxID=2282421 RepID=A0A369PW54_9SPHI|nr:class I SAM-dependent methyltransferase [Pedobacter chinensis]RDC54919.1 class I SAM-dependent methyltransferase [Pedobacter chinensis]
MDNNYDKIAKHYDFLSRLVFFKSQVNAQINQLKYIPSNSSVLIVGGGTGWILEEIAKVHSSGLNIVYVELSEKMVALSKNRDFQENNVEFVNLSIEDYQTTQSFDIILTPFLFDNFSEERAGHVFRKLNHYLKEKGLWFLVDFSLNNIHGKWWKSIMLKLMYWFFKLIGIVEARQLIDMHPYFEAIKYQTIEKRFYYKNFIAASIYKK